MIHSESPADVLEVRGVHEAAFPTQDEANLVDRLRANGNLLVSLIVRDGKQTVGHIAFSPVTINDAAGRGVGLAPVAVLPSHHRRGYGSQLVRAGLDACRKLGIEWVVVLGDPAYYHRFGFRSATPAGLQNEYGAGDEFMVLELVPHSLTGIQGRVRFGSEFRIFEH